MTDRLTLSSRSRSHRVQTGRPDFRVLSWSRYRPITDNRSDLLRDIVRAKWHWLLWLCAFRQLGVLRVLVCVRSTTCTVTTRTTSHAETQNLHLYISLSLYIYIYLSITLYLISVWRFPSVCALVWRDCNAVIKVKCSVTRNYFHFWCDVRIKGAILDLKKKFFPCLITWKKCSAWMLFF